MTFTVIERFRYLNNKSTKNDEGPTKVQKIILFTPPCPTRRKHFI